MERFRDLLFVPNPAESPAHENRLSEFPYFIRLYFAYTPIMGLDVGGHENRPDWPKMGPSLLIATALILAIRTAKWPANFSATESDRELEKEIEYAAHLAGRVLSTLVHRKEGIFPSIKKAWYMPNDEDTPK
jgi:hypothetical protein